MGSVQVLNRLQDSQARPYRPLRVVFVGDGRTEHGHDGIADELLHRPAQALDLAPQVGVVETKPSDHILWVGPVRAGSEANKVTEQHGDDLALVAPTSRSGAEGGAAAAAKRKPP
jgi:hypothetical protein